MKNIEQLIDLVMLYGDKQDQAALRAANHVGGVVVGLDHNDVSELKREALPAPELRDFQSLGTGFPRPGRPRPVFLSRNLTMHLLEQQTRLDNLLAHWVLKDDMIVKQEQVIRSQEMELHGTRRMTRYHQMRLNLLLSVPGVLEVPGVEELLEKWGMGLDDNLPEDIA